MKILIVLPLFLGIATAQFGGFGGGFGNVANTFQQGIGNVAGRLSSTIQPLGNVQTFSDFVSQAGKTYSKAEEALRESVFIGRKNLVESGNAAFDAGTTSFKMGLNTLADLTNAEFLKQLTGNKKSAQGEEKAKRHRQSPTKKPGPVPDAFDWREKGGVTPVKFQGDCGSCWSFATTGAIEGHIFAKTGKLPNLSEQNLVDCGKEDFGLAGCDGGYQEYAFEFITTQNGIADGAKYPYLDKKDACKYKPALKSAAITGFATIPPNDEKTMKEVIAKHGPLACSLNGLESLLLYKEGIYDDPECNKDDVNHSVLVVGYGSENGKDYWIVKNSWGDAWGEKGYFRLPRGNNFCKIASECSYPVL